MELVHANPDTPFDPSVQYAPCCHPKHAPRGSVAHESYEAHITEIANAHNAAKAARRAAADK